MTTSNETPTPEPVFNPSQGRFNRAAIKRQFKEVSRVTRAGKFTRVSEDAINRAEAAAEAKIRAMMDTSVKSPLGGFVAPLGTTTFLTGAGRARLNEAFNRFMAGEIQRIVNDTRTGSTL